MEGCILKSYVMRKRLLLTHCVNIGIDTLIEMG